MSADRTGASRPWRAVAGGAVVSVRLQPKASREGIDGITTLSDGSTSLKVRVRALPEKGEANKALIRLLAKTLGIARRDLELAAGAKDRNKSVRIAGDPGDIMRLLDERLAGLERKQEDD